LNVVWYDLLGLPDENGRLEILNIHTSNLRQHKNIENSVDLKQLAAQTKNFTGAEIMGLVGAASSYAMTSLVDPQQIQDKPLDLEKMLLTNEHFQLALAEVKPAFGADNSLTKAPCTLKGLLVCFERIFF